MKPKFELPALFTLSGDHVTSSTLNEGEEEAFNDCSCGKGWFHNCETGGTEVKPA